MNAERHPFEVPSGFPAMRRVVFLLLITEQQPQSQLEQQ